MSARYLQRCGRRWQTAFYEAYGHDSEEAERELDVAVDVSSNGDLSVQLVLALLNDLYGGTLLTCANMKEGVFNVPALSQCPLSSGPSRHAMRARPSAPPQRGAPG